ncbi:MAG: hypothetical protein OHK0013_00080 [Sandaracinaceae bacterium]
MRDVTGRPRTPRSALGRTLDLATRGIAASGILFGTGLVGCESGPRFTYEVAPTRAPDPTTRPVPTIVAAPDNLPAADPLLPGFDGWPIVFDVRRTGAQQHCRAELRRGGNVLRAVVGELTGTRCVVTWDGLGAGGTRITPGPIEVEGQLLDRDGTVLARAREAIEVVRLGIERIELSGEEGARQPLLYRAMGGRRDGWFEIPASYVPFQMRPDARETGASALELADGTPRAIPMPHDGLLSPPLEASGAVEDDTYNVPTAWVAGSRIDYAVTLSADLAGVEGGGAPTTTEVRVMPPAGLSASGDVTFRDGAVLRFGGAPVTAVDRYDLAHDFGFEARRPGGEWQPVPGAFSVTLRMYGLVGAPVFARTTIPHRPWVDVVDTVTRWVGGASMDQAGVGAAIVRGVYLESGLRYDTRSGASSYTDYLSGWSGSVFDAQAFQDRRYGSVINCSDAASIVSVYANMVGLDFRYRILTHRTADGFRLNYLQGIGSPEFRFSPFDSGRNYFRYHAIVNSRDVRTWDATLAVDGDGTPSAPPFTQLLVQGLDPMAYLVALSPEAASITTQMDDLVRIQ